MYGVNCSFTFFLLEQVEEETVIEAKKALDIGISLFQHLFFFLITLRFGGQTFIKRSTCKGLNVLLSWRFGCKSWEKTSNLKSRKGELLTQELYS